MILVTLGTFPTEFKRPLIALEALCETGEINEKIIVQSGHTEMDSPYMEVRPFIPPDELTEICKKARLLITHAGTGSLIKGIKLNKKIIAIARLSKLGEMVDDHQVEILNEFVAAHYIMPWHENEQLKDVLTRLENFEPSPYVSNKQNIIDYLDKYIMSL